MKFNPGQNRIRRGGVTYIKDAIQTQVDPPKKEEIRPKEKIKQPKKEKDESVQHEQVVQKPVSKRGRSKGRPSSR